MVILYTLKDGDYIDLKNIKKGKNETIHSSIYVNLTSSCPCSCIFCLRDTKELDKSNNLWLEREPTVEEIIEEFKKYDLTEFKEIIFCGFGEPFMRLEDLLEVSKYLKNTSSSIPIRINTNGLGDLIYGKDTAPLLKGLIDIVSISLNASNAEEYLRLTRNKFGLESYDAMLNFALKCKEYVSKVVMTVVDCIGQEEIDACKVVCDRLGLTLRVRVFE